MAYSCTSASGGAGTDSSSSSCDTGLIVMGERSSVSCGISRRDGLLLMVVVVQQTGSGPSSSSSSNTRTSSDAGCCTVVVRSCTGPGSIASSAEWLATLHGVIALLMMVLARKPRLSYTGFVKSAGLIIDNIIAMVLVLVEEILHS